MGGRSGGSPAMFPLPVLLVGVAMGGGKSSETNFENFLILGMGFLYTKVYAGGIADLVSSHTPR